MTPSTCDSSSIQRCRQSSSRLFDRADLGPSSPRQRAPLLGIGPGLLAASPPRRAPARLALEAPGSEVESGLIDMTALWPDAQRRSARPASDRRRLARLAVEAPASAGSGVVAVSRPDLEAEVVDLDGFVLRPTRDVLPTLLTPASGTAALQNPGVRSRVPVLLMVAATAVTVASAAMTMLMW